MKPFSSHKFCTKRPRIVNSALWNSEQGNPNVNNHKGYTLTELVVTIALLAFLGLVLSTGSVFDISGWLAHARINAATRELANNLQYTKMEAISRNDYCSVTFNQPLGDETYDYIIFEDPNENLKYDSGETVLKRASISSHKGVSFDTEEGEGDGLTFPANDAGLPSIAFDPLGLPKIKTNDFDEEKAAYLTDTRGNHTRVLVSSVGRIRTE